MFGSKACVTSLTIIKNISYTCLCLLHPVGTVLMHPSCYPQRDGLEIPTVYFCLFACHDVEKKILSDAAKSMVFILNLDYLYLIYTNIKLLLVSH